MSCSGTNVRWGTDADRGTLSRLGDLNGRPRRKAFESRFVVAEKGGRVLAAMPYRSADGGMLAGEAVVDPWSRARELSGEVYRALVRLGVEIKASEVRVEGAGRPGHLVEAGYRHGLCGSPADVVGGAGRRSRPALREGVRCVLGRTSIPRMQTAKACKGGSGGWGRRPLSSSFRVARGEGRHQRS